MPRCSACGATQLTPPTKFDYSGATVASMTFRPRSPQPGFFGIVVGESFRVDHARACLACGNVMPVLSPAKLAELRWKIGGLDPIE